MTAQTADAGLDARGYRLQFQRLLARPLLLVAMVLVAAAFSLRFFRFGGIAKTLAGGVAAGFVLYIATEIFSDLGGAGTISHRSPPGRPRSSGPCLARCRCCIRKMVDAAPAVRAPMSPRTPGLRPGGQGGPSVAPTMGRRSPQG